MRDTIALSANSKALLAELIAVYQDPFVLDMEQSLDDVNIKKLVSWLSQNHPCDKKAKFWLESIYGSLLHDLSSSLSGALEEEPSIPKTWYSTLLFVTLALSGTIVAFCEAFDGIASILGLFSSIPVWGALVGGLVFSAFAVFVFYVVELYEVTDHLGIELRHSRKLLDIYDEQRMEINRLAGILDSKYSCTAFKDLKIFSDIQAMLLFRFNALDGAREIYRERSQNTLLKTAKFILASGTGLIIFGGGFFAGQTFALTASSLFIAGGASATCWPVLLICIAAGLAAVTMFWVLERPAFENFAARWCGLYQDKIDNLVDEEKVHEGCKQLDLLADKINGKISDLSQYQRSPLQKMEHKHHTTESHLRFFPRSKSFDDIPEKITDKFTQLCSPH